MNHIAHGNAQMMHMGDGEMLHQPQPKYCKITVITRHGRNCANARLDACTGSSTE